MIDLHCHILPGVDDGALDLRDCAAMARQAAADGIEAVCATPHIRHDHDVRIEEVAEPGRGAEPPPARGGDPGHGPERRRGGRDRGRGAERGGTGTVCLGAGRWILLEPAPGPLGDSLQRRVEPARRARPPGADRPPRAPSLRRHVRADGGAGRAGALIQATADFFLRERTAAGMLALAERRPRPRAQQRRPLLARRPPGELARRSRGWARSSRSPPPGLDRARRPARSSPAGARSRAPRSELGAWSSIALQRAQSVEGAQLDPLGEVVDDGAVAAAEAVAEEVGGAGGGADPQRSSQPSPAAMQAARPPIIESPQPSRAPRSKRGGISSQASSPRSDQRRLPGAGDDRRRGAAPPAGARSRPASGPRCRPGRRRNWRSPSR